jgi:hypothetical protein
MSLAGAVTVNDPYLAIRAAVDGLGITYTAPKSAQAIRSLKNPFFTD